MGWQAYNREVTGRGSCIQNHRPKPKHREPTIVASYNRWPTPELGKSDATYRWNREMTYAWMYGVSGLACDESRWSYQGRTHTIPQGRWVEKGITTIWLGKLSTNCCMSSQLTHSSNEAEPMTAGDRLMRVKLGWCEGVWFVRAEH